uniref:Putative serine proteinase inhibitor n=1 Tax=Amblyomma tuberculatum TaxID=48802 RepID=A0A6M2E3R8_9ACAR
MANMATASLLMLATACTLLAQASAGPRSAQTAIGHCRGLGGGCLLPSHDPTRCWRANEEYKTCVSSTCLEPTCSKPVLGPICTADCRRGCFCRDGFYRNRFGRCVRWHMCNEWGWPQPPFYPSYPGWWGQINPWYPEFGFQQQAVPYSRF